MDELKNAIKEIVEQEIIKVVISNKKNKDEKYKKIDILLKINSKGKKYYQVEKFTEKQVFHENIELENLEEKINEYIVNYKQLSAWSNEASFDLKISKKGKVFLGRKRATM